MSEIHTDDAKIYADAIACQDACNAQGVANLLVEAYAVARRETYAHELRGVARIGGAPNRGTDYINTHPAVVLILNKLTNLATNDLGDAAAFSKAYDACKERSK